MVIDEKKEEAIMLNEIKRECKNFSVNSKSFLSSCF